VSRNGNLLNTTEMIGHVFASKARLALCRKTARYTKYADLINCSFSHIELKNTAFLLPYAFTQIPWQNFLLWYHTLLAKSGCCKNVIAQKKKKIKGHKNI